MNKTFSIVKSETQDIPVLNAIALQSKKYWGYPEDWIEHWKEDLKVTREQVADHNVYKLIQDDTALGFICIENYSDYYEITHLWVLPEYIGKGLGKLLLNTSLRLTLDKSYKKTLVTADPNAIPFYKKMGFTKEVGKEESYPKGRFLTILQRD